MLPRLGSSKLVSNWILVTLGVSIVAAVDGGFLARWLALAPTRILHGEVWRLLTWPFVEPGPIGLVLTCAAIYKFGSELASIWGDRRLQRFMLQIIVGAAAFFCLLATIAGSTHVWRLGGWAVPDVLLIAWARQYPERVLRVYGMLELRGAQLVNITVGVMILFGIYFGPVAVAPELAACVAAAVYPREWLRS